MRDVADLRQRLIDTRCKALWAGLLMKAYKSPVWMKTNILNICCDT